jgi:hypothetical protein
MTLRDYLNNSLRLSLCFPNIFFRVALTFLCKVVKLFNRFRLFSHPILIVGNKWEENKSDPRAEWEQPFGKAFVELKRCKYPPIPVFKGIPRVSDNLTCLQRQASISVQISQSRINIRQKVLTNLSFSQVLSTNARYKTRSRAGGRNNAASRPQ